MDERDLVARLADLDLEEQKELNAVKAKYEERRKVLLEGGGQALSSPVVEPSSKQNVTATTSKTRGQDWLCPRCDDFQFARNKQCRKCGAPNPHQSSQGQNVKPAMNNEKKQDWRCPNCSDLQFARNKSCRKCGTERLTEEEIQLRRIRDEIRKEEEEEKKFELQIRKAQFLSNPDRSCWGAKWVLPYFQNQQRSSLSITLYDDDPSGMKPTPLNERGIELRYVSDAPADQQWHMYSWSNWGGDRSTQLVCKWSEDEPA